MRVEHFHVDARQQKAGDPASADDAAADAGCARNGGERFRGALIELIVDLLIASPA